MFSAFADLSILELLLIAGMGVLTSLIGGVAGYGTGALMPLVLVPIVGAEPVVPIIAISALITNASRATAFQKSIDWRRALIVLCAATPTCMLGAYGYTLLSTTSSYPGTVAVRAKLPFDPAASFVPVAMIARAPIVLAVHPSVPANNVKEFIAAEMHKLPK